MFLDSKCFEGVNECMSKESFGSFVPDTSSVKRNTIEDISTNMCPKCFECDVSEDNSIIFAIEDEWWTYGCYCYGGFGKKTYIFQPHYCRACDSAFWEYKTVERLHIGTIIACILLCIFSIVSVLMLLLSIYATYEDRGMFICLFATLGLIPAGISAFYLGTENCYKDKEVEVIISDHYYYCNSLNDSLYFRSKFNIEKLSDQERKALKDMVCSSANRHLYLGGKDYENLF